MDGRSTLEATIHGTLWHGSIPLVGVVVGAHGHTSRGLAPVGKDSESGRITAVEGEHVLEGVVECDLSDRSALHGKGSDFLVHTDIDSGCGDQ